MMMMAGMRAELHAGDNLPETASGVKCKAWRRRWLEPRALGSSNPRSRLRSCRHEWSLPCYSGVEMRGKSGKGWGFFCLKLSP